MSETSTRKELQDFLKTRRARLSPSEVGLPAGNGRRTHGLRREEVAVLAGVGLTWYTWLEQGREIQVSTAFLENLARALKLGDAERAHLFALAQQRLPPLPKSSSQPNAHDGLQSILDAIESPAYARNSCFDVVAWNAANTLIFGDFASIAAPERNVIKLMFRRAHYRKNMPNWESDARGLVAKFRMNFGMATGDNEFSALISELTAFSPDFCRMWAEYDVSDLGEGVTYFSTPRHGGMVFQHYTMMPEAFPDLRIIIFIPAQRA